MAEEAFFGTALLLVAACAADGSIELVLVDSVEEGNGLELVTAGIVAGLFLDATLVNALLDAADNEVGTQLLYQVVTIVDGLLKVVTGIYVDQRERYLSREECLVGKMRDYNGVLAAGKEYARTLKLRRNLTEDINGLRLQFFKMCDVMIHYSTCILWHLLNVQDFF